MEGAKMRQKTGPQETAEQHVGDIRCETWRVDLMEEFVRAAGDDDGDDGGGDTGGPKPPTRPKGLDRAKWPSRSSRHIRDWNFDRGM